VTGSTGSCAGHSLEAVLKDASSLPPTITDGRTRPGAGTPSGPPGSGVDAGPRRGMPLVEAGLQAESERWNRPPAGCRGRGRRPPGVRKGRRAGIGDRLMRLGGILSSSFVSHSADSLRGPSGPADRIRSDAVFTGVRPPLPATRDRPGRRARSARPLSPGRWAVPDAIAILERGRGFEDPVDPPTGGTATIGP
jgi:hypothetical protein